MRTLPLSAEVEEIADAITAVQRRARVGRCQDPIGLAQAVRSQIGRAAWMASAVDTRLEELRPAGSWWETPEDRAHPVTRVRLEGGRLVVERAWLPGWVASGQLTLTLDWSRP